MSNPDPALLTGLGAAFSIFLTSAGSAVASVQAGKYAMKSSGGPWSFAPIIIAGVLAIYGIIVSVILAHRIQDQDANQTTGFKNLSAGLAVGLACLMSGIGMAKFLEDAVETPQANETSSEEPLIQGRAMRQQLLKTSWRFLMVLVFLEAIGLYGLIVALFIMS